MEKRYFDIINRNFKPYQPSIFKLYQKLGSFAKVYQELKKENQLNDEICEIYEEKLKKIGVEIILFNEEFYPQKLKEIDAPPLGFYALGNTKLLKEEKLFLAVVGTRKASIYGKNIAKKFAQQLADLGIVIISGLAYGIDEYSHLGVIEAQGKTVAILGEGIDLALNSPKRRLIEKILKNDGLIISEYSLETSAMPYHFPLRNRLIAGLSEGVLVIEAPLDSGALITANYALRYGKEIFVVPGEITNKNFEGSHNLIKQGAKLITSIEDILIEFGIDYEKKEKFKKLRLTPKEEIVYETLKIGPKTIEEISKAIDLPIQELLIILTNMEVKEIIKNKDGKFFVL